ncbi:hypothetical protein NA57DRAFT_58385 [Rhizodiscina lignyota]|uniref:C2H2-type domain-containing protein n=1 Tax=Rhizodiscina lignyota TaxID=1504668 RepID=A0A9P4I7K5_9PEZI|nr:hypothetical protein NA57DRAFT_58385 [Rhizodiscina lignyota]
MDSGSGSQPSGPHWLTEDGTGTMDDTDPIWNNATGNEFMENFNALADMDVDSLNFDRDSISVDTGANNNATRSFQALQPVARSLISLERDHGPDPDTAERGFSDHWSIQHSDNSKRFKPAPAPAPAPANTHNLGPAGVQYCMLWLQLNSPKVPKESDIASLSVLSGQPKDAVESWFGNRMLRQGSASSTYTLSNYSSSGIPTSDSGSRINYAFNTSQTSFASGSVDNHSLSGAASVAGTGPAPRDDNDIKDLNRCKARPPGDWFESEGVKSAFVRAKEAVCRGGKELGKHCRPTKDLSLLARDCDRPFQCTRKCGKRFKEKKDWKRHEQTRYPQEGWICTVPATVRVKNSVFCAYCPSGHQVENPTPEHLKSRHRKSFDSLDQMELRMCEYTAYRRQHIIQHFEKIHPSLSPTEWINNGHFKIPRSQYPRYCGFCRSVFSSWGERIDHIASHFVDDELDMRRWRDHDSSADNDNEREKRDRDDSDHYDESDDSGSDDDSNKPPRVRRSVRMRSYRPSQREHYTGHQMSQYLKTNEQSVEEYCYRHNGNHLNNENQTICAWLEYVETHPILEVDTAGQLNDIYDLQRRWDSLGTFGKKCIPPPEAWERKRYLHLVLSNSKGVFEFMRSYPVPEDIQPNIPRSCSFYRPPTSERDTRCSGKNYEYREINFDALQLAWDPREYFLWILKDRAARLLNEWEKILVEVECRVGRDLDSMAYGTSEGDHGSAVTENVKKTFDRIVPISRLLNLLQGTISETRAAWQGLLSSSEDMGYFFELGSSQETSTGQDRARVHLHDIKKTLGCLESVQQRLLPQTNHCHELLRVYVTAYHTFRNEFQILSHCPHRYDCYYADRTFRCSKTSVLMVEGSRGEYAEAEARDT